MQTATSFTAPISDLHPGNLENLMVALDHYRRRSEWLLQLNSLHERLAGALDLAGMVESFSIWLMPLIEHDLLAYHNFSRNRGHMFCSCHGPDRRQIMKAAETVFQSLAQGAPMGADLAGGFEMDYWPLFYKQEEGYLLLLRRRGAITPGESKTVETTLKVLRETLQRVLDYEAMYQQARRDALTGLANRRVLEERLGPLLESARRHGHPLTLASMDLDNFKQVNDTYGHSEGDVVLQKVAQRLSKSIRKSDLLVRSGGDELLLVLPDTTLESAQKLADRLCKAISRLDIRTPAGKLGISIGLAQWQADLSTEEWFQRADENLYRAKSRGRSQVCVTA